MNNNTKLEIAKEIMATMIADKCKNGFDPNDKDLLNLLEESKKMKGFDEKTIDKIINVYGPLTKNGGQNE